MKKHLWKISGLVLLVGIAAIAAYIATQQPRVWCDRQWAGLALYKGGYRSWTLTFCDGFTFGAGGKLQPVVVVTNELTYGNYITRTGYYHWPKYNHSDLKKLGIAPPP